MLTLPRRKSWLGGDYSGKVTMEDGKTIRTLVYELEAVDLNDRELNVLLSDPHAHEALYKHTPEGIRPFLTCFKSLEFDKPIEVANVKVWYGLDSEFESMLEFATVTLSKIKLALTDGGISKMSCKVRTAPTLDETFAQFLSHLGTPVEAEIILVPPGAQQDLPLNTHGLGEVSLEPKLKSRGRGKGREGAILQSAPTSRAFL